MDRITERDCNGVALIPIVPEKDGQKRDPAEHAKRLREAIPRLADFEDIGMEPEDIERLKALMYPMTMDELERAKELAQAERDGHLVQPDAMQIPWVKAILSERERQDKKWGFPQENTYCEWAAILAEETGELAKELNELNFGRGDPERMRSEAVQVAAVSLALLEQSTTAYLVTAQVTEALGRLTHQEAKAVSEQEGD